jgi:hypothetical protein
MKYDLHMLFFIHSTLSTFVLFILCGSKAMLADSSALHPVKVYLISRSTSMTMSRNQIFLTRAE